MSQLPVFFDITSIPSIKHRQNVKLYFQDRPPCRHEVAPAEDEKEDLLYHQQYTVWTMLVLSTYGSPGFFQDRPLCHLGAPQESKNIFQAVDIFFNPGGGVKPLYRLYWKGGAEMIAEIIFTGTELLLGQILNTNARLLQQELSALGIDLYYQVTVGDNLYRCAAAIKQAAGRADLIIIGGGLGPTEDDISREALARALQVELEQDPEALVVVRRFFDRRGIPISQNNLKQALVPRGGQAVDNPIGTAPGIILERDNRTYILVPGPPSEFNMMVREKVIPFLRDKLAGQVGVIQSRVLKFCGIGESTLDEKLGDLLKSGNPTLAPTAKYTEVHLRITAKAKEQEKADQMIGAMEARVRERLGTYIFGVDGETLPGAVSTIIREKGNTIATVEDFTGGQLSFQFSSAPGAKDIYVAGIVVKDYNRFKGSANLGWGDLPEEPGARAKHLASAIRRQFATHIGIAVTSGQSTELKGHVKTYPLYIAGDFNDLTMVREIPLRGEREEVARRGPAFALMLVWRHLKHGIPF